MVKTITFILLVWGLTGNILYGQSILFVSGSDSSALSTGDQVLIDRMLGKDFKVTVKGGPSSPLMPEDAYGKTLVFISSTITASLVGTIFKDVEVPVIVCEAFLLDDMKMTANIAGVDYGIRSNSTTLSILEPSHPIAQNLSTPVEVTQSGTSLVWGKPSSEAVRIAQMSGLGGADQYAVFLYEPGDNMFDMSAPALRIGFFLRDNAISLLTADGWTLFDNTLDYIYSDYCLVQPDTLEAETSLLTLLDSTAMLTAIMTGAGYVPQGYERIFLLTEGGDKVIRQLSADPQFEVDTSGNYYIHSLIYYPQNNSSDYINLDFIQTGVTKISDLDSLILNEQKCASLDVQGVKFQVLPCEVSAALVSYPSSATLIDGARLINGNLMGNHSLQPGYTARYLLTEGPTQTIVDIQPIPEFTLTQTGEFGIHSLVFDSISLSPNFLDLTFVDPGTTSLDDIRLAIQQQQVCAVVGEQTSSILIDVCNAFAGTVQMDQDSLFLGGGPVSISGTPTGDASIPEGFSMGYVLTADRGGLIHGKGSSPVFDVAFPGNFSIHPIVYQADPNSADFFDFAVIDSGITTLDGIYHILDSLGVCADMKINRSSVFVEASVHFINFEVSEKEGPKSLLFWSVSEAIKGATYTVERSADSVLFKVLFTREELITSLTPPSYIYIDVAPLAGRIYYRIKYTNTNSTFFYSEILPLEITGELVPVFSVYPNPSVNQVTVEALHPDPGTFDLRLVDNRGAILEMQRVNFGEKVDIQLDMSKYPRGVYHINLVDFENFKNYSYNFLKH